MLSILCKVRVNIQSTPSPGGRRLPEPAGIAAEPRFANTPFTHGMFQVRPVFLFDLLPATFFVLLPISTRTGIVASDFGTAMKRRPFWRFIRSIMSSATSLSENASIILSVLSKNRSETAIETPVS